MQRRKDFDLFLKWLICIALLPFLLVVSLEGELSESDSFYDFIRFVDPQNVLRIDWNGLVANPCSPKLKGVKCNLQANTIREIRLENLNLSGIIDAESLCKLKNLQILSLAKNIIRGSIPNSISYCTRLTYLNLSSNLLSGRVPVALTKLKQLRRLDISNNHFTSINLHFKQKFKLAYRYSMEPNASQMNTTQKLMKVMASKGPPPSLSPDEGNFDPGNSEGKEWTAFLPLIFGMGFFSFFAYYVHKKAAKVAKEKAILKALQDSPQKMPRAKDIEEVKPEERKSELVFFVEEQERFKLDDLFDSTADLRSQTLCSSLYKVRLKNNAFYAVKRLKNLQVSFEEFGRTMRQIGKLKHSNLLPLVGFNSTDEEKLLIYRYQSNGSLLSLLEGYIGGKRDFPWKLRVSIASGIAKGLDFIYQRSDEQKCIPHGNLKLSNILLDENEEPLISEYGISQFLDPKRTTLFSSNGYTAPEKTLSEQGDVFSFGVILLELLTGKAVEKSGIDLPKWVRAMVREEWTGEVFDKEVSNAGKQWAFPMLNVALKCVSHSPENRPTMAEVVEKMEEILNAEDDHSVSDMSSTELNHQDCCLLHTVIPETWDTPGSNY